MNNVPYTSKEAARLLRVSPATIREYIRSKQLEAIKSGRQYLIPREALQLFIDAKRVG